jgi:hypothetical protein
MQVTRYQQNMLRKAPQHTVMGLRQRTSVMILFCSATCGTAFVHTNTFHRQPPRINYMSISWLRKSSNTNNPSSPLSQSLTTTRAANSFRSMIPTSVLLDAMIEYTAKTSSHQNTIRNVVTASTTSTSFGRALPMAFVTKAFTAPTAAAAITGTTTTMITAAAAGTMFSGSHPDAITVETQVLNDMSHLGIDLAVFFTPSLLLLRIAAIIGRICTITADYIPDHVIVPEELAFQFVMLTLACLGLIKSSLIPTAAAAYNATSVKDGRAFGSIFQPAGTTWMQYKALATCGVLEWITLQASDVVFIPSNNDDDAPTSRSKDLDEYMYWLYSGDVKVETDNGDLQYVVSSEKKASSSYCGLFGENCLLQSSVKNIQKSKHARGKKQPDQKPISSCRRLSVTSCTATLLRIDTRRLQLLMDLDPALAESMRTMVFQGVEAKLHAKVQETTNLLKSFNVTSTATAVTM